MDLYIPYIITNDGEDAWAGDIYTDQILAERELMRRLWRRGILFEPEFDRLCNNDAPPVPDPEIHSEDCEDVDPGSTFEFMRDTIENYEQRRSQMRDGNSYVDHFEADVLALLTPESTIWNITRLFVPYGGIVREYGVWKKTLIT